MSSATFLTSDGAGPSDGKPLADGDPAADGSAAERRRAASDAPAEDHWSVVLKSLAPHGYHKSPPWQQELIGRVVKQMAARQKPTRGDGSQSKEAMARTIDLSALGVSADAAETFRAEEQRVARTMSELPALRARGARRAASAGAAEGAAEGAASQAREAGPDLLTQLVADRTNQVHHYVRSIQMEQLLEQDLSADLKAVRDEVHKSVTDESFAEGAAKKAAQRVEKQLMIIRKRCDALTMKRSEIASDNATTRGEIDNLRREKMTHREQVMRMQAKAEKMDHDIAFLTQQAHTALDGREKVRGKFLMAQRDMMQEREQKLAVIAELVARANALDEDHEARRAQLADSEETRRRQQYGAGRRRREASEGAEVRYGYLAAQSRGWEAEFERLQAFTGM
jgi:hypothetical protein